MANKTTVVHVTHEATGKIGGIGAVLNGLFTCNSYLKAVERSILVGPLFTTDCPLSERLGDGGKILYSSLDRHHDTRYTPAFQMIEQFFNAGIVYGTKEFIDRETDIKSTVEVLLVDVRFMHEGPINEFKKRMFSDFGIESNLYEHIWECEQYVRLAPVAIAALKEIGAGQETTTIISHEFMGMATALAGIIEPSCNFKTAFYAHEVATMRRIVEKHAGHDTMFYNVLENAHDNRLYVDDVFGDQKGYFKHAFVDASKFCDLICAVGDYVVKELKFLAPEFEEANINIVYNGIPAYEIGIIEKMQSRRKLQRYCENLLGYRPDFIFTHVTRLVSSKGLWRDLNILEHIEREFRTQGKTGVMYVLSTQVAKRKTSDILHIESRYSWPVAHRESHHDMSGGEADFYTKVQEFNARSRNIKVVFINQFGFDRKSCGKRIPEDMEFMDIRKGSDVEFGLSIYEPFGIAQLEPLSFGGICVASNVCGCIGFVLDTTGAEGTKNVVIADYTNLSAHGFSGFENHEDIDASVRLRIEQSVSEKVAMQICSRLPKSEDEIEIMLKEGYKLARNMSWDVVVNNYLLPSWKKALFKQNGESVYSKI